MKLFGAAVAAAAVGTVSVGRHRVYLFVRRIVARAIGWRRFRSA